MDGNGFKIVKQREHYMLYQYGVFKCSGDTRQEIEEAIDELLR